MAATSAALPPGPVGSWVRSPDVLWRWSLDRVLLLPPESEGPFVLTGPGAALWDLLEAPMSTEALIVELANLYDVDRDTVQAEVVPLLAELTERGGLRLLP